MSWQAYVENMEKGVGQCKYATIRGKNGSLWAESQVKDFSLTSEEVAQISNILTNQSSDVAINGITLGGKSFTCLRLEDETMVLQGKSPHKDLTIVAAISGQAVIIGYNPDSNIKPPSVRVTVDSIKDYLKNAGY